MRTVVVDKAKAQVYWKKAQEFVRIMNSAKEQGEWDAAGVVGVHAAISAADALSVFYFGVRSRDADHQSAAQLLRRLRMDGIEKKADLFVEIVRHKNLLEYEARTLGERETVALVKRVERFMTWAGEGLAFAPEQN